MDGYTVAFVQNRWKCKWGPVIPGDPRCDRLCHPPLPLGFAFKLRGVKPPSPLYNKHWQQGALRTTNFDRSGNIMNPTGSTMRAGK